MSLAYPPLADQNCGNCRFCCPTSPSGPQCRRHAPMPVPDPMQFGVRDLTSFWPAIQYADWCGEWAPREAQQ